MVIDMAYQVKCFFVVGKNKKNDKAIARFRKKVRGIANNNRDKGKYV